MSWSFGDAGRTLNTAACCGEPDGEEMVVYLLVSLWQMPDEPWSRLQALIEEGVASLLGRAPGLIEGYWAFEASNRKSIALILLETADHAYDLRNALEHLMEEQGVDGMELEMIRVQEVVARIASERRPAGQVTRV